MSCCMCVCAGVYACWCVCVCVCDWRHLARTTGNYLKGVAVVAVVAAVAAVAVVADGQSKCSFLKKVAKNAYLDCLERQE